MSIEQLEFEFMASYSRKWEGSVKIFFNFAGKRVKLLKIIMGEKGGGYFVIIVKVRLG